MLIEYIKSKSFTIKLLLILSFVLLAITYSLSYTANGIELLLNARLKDPTAKISVSHLSNNINGTTTIEDLRFTSESLDIEFKNLSLTWNPLSLFSDQVVISTTTSESLAVNLKNINTENTTLKLGFPFATHIHNATIYNSVIKINGNLITSLASTQIENLYVKDNYFADKILLKTKDGRWAKLSGRFGFSPNSVINLTTETAFNLSDEKIAVRASGTLVGTSAQLRFLQDINAPVVAKMNGRIQHVFSSPRLTIDTMINSPIPSSLSIAKYIENLSGVVSINGTLEKIEIDSNLAIRTKDNNQWTTSMVASTLASQLNFDIQSKSAASKSSALLSGTLNLAGINNKSAAGTSFKGSWQNLTLTSDGSNVFSKEGNISFDGDKYLAVVNAKDLQVQKGPHIRKLSMHTRMDSDSSFSFHGTAKSTKGNLKLSGSMTTVNNELKLNNMHLSGNNFTLVRKPQAHIIVSPDLAFVRKDNTINSKGTVWIPTANIQLNSVKNTFTQISSLLGHRGKGLNTNSNVELKFGKAVWMHGFGLNAHVTGDLSLRDLSGKQLLATGELDVLRGNYKNLSRKLSVHSGRLKFDNHDLDNPELELSIRKTNTNDNNENKITGRLQKLYKQTKENSAGTRLDKSSDKIAFNEN